MTGVLILLASLLGLACWFIWLCETAPEVDDYDDITALAEAAGVLATRDELHAETLAYAEAQRDLTDERIAAWLEDAR